jgi:pimeloyl-ACP methyl ester carboxylesterase
MRRRVLTATVVVLAVLLTGLGALWLGQRRLIYFPDTGVVPPAGQVLDGARDVALDTADGLRLGAWLVPPRPTGPDRNVVVLSAPGNAGNRAGRVGLARGLSAAGFTVLLIDYRGYGGNPGRPTEAGLAHDLRAAQEFLTRAGWAEDRTIYLGESLGCAAVVALAAQRAPAGLVLRSPFRDLAAVAGHHYPIVPVRVLLRDRYPVADLVAQIIVPTVVVYGSADTIVPPEQSLSVARRAAGPVQVVRVEGADHNDAVLAEGPALIGAISALADRLDT